MPNLDGIDVSDAQGYPDWGVFADAYPDIKFVSFKATQGTYFTAHTFAYNWARLRDLVRAGWSHKRTLPSPPILIPYHFATQEDVGAQTHHFQSVVGGLGPYETVMIDFEPAGKVPSLSVDHCIALMNTMGAATGRLVTAYRGFYYLGDADPRYNAYPQWIAAYGISSPRRHREPMIWQYGGAKVPGVTPGHDVDADEVWDYGRLLSISASGSPVPPPPPPTPAPSPAIAQETDMRSITQPEYGNHEVFTVAAGQVVHQWYDAKGNPSGYVPVANNIGTMVGVDVNVVGTTVVVTALGAYGGEYISLYNSTHPWNNWVKMSDWLAFTAPKA